jgi:hypothetical protein
VKEESGTRTKQTGPVGEGTGLMERYLRLMPSYCELAAVEGAAAARRRLLSPQGLQPSQESKVFISLSTKSPTHT